MKTFLNTTIVSATCLFFLVVSYSFIVTNGNNEEHLLLEDDVSYAEEGLEQCRTYFQNYQAQNTSDNFQGLAISPDVLNAANNIGKVLSEAAGYRLYMGIKNEAPVIIVCGVNSAGQDLVAPLYVVENNGGQVIGPCPQTCDYGSPITK